jgi:hypothetical protein
MGEDGLISLSVYKAIEFVMLFGGALAFGYWQLRSVRRADEAARAQAEASASRPAGHAER